MSENGYISFWEFCASSEEDAKAFIAETKERGYDVEEEVFHAKPGTDGRFSGEGFNGLQEAWLIQLYVDWDNFPKGASELLEQLCDKHHIDDWGSEPSSSFEPGERDASKSVRV